MIDRSSESQILVRAQHTRNHNVHKIGYGAASKIFSTPCARFKNGSYKLHKYMQLFDASRGAAGESEIFSIGKNDSERTR